MLYVRIGPCHLPELVHAVFMHLFMLFACVGGCGWMWVRVGGCGCGCGCGWVWVWVWVWVGVGGCGTSSD